MTEACLLLQSADNILKCLRVTENEAKNHPEKKKHINFLREKFESAKWFIACIQQRRDTLMKIMQAIFERQYEFFEKGPKALQANDLQRYC